MNPAWLEALILGIVQGLTEFIPVSSSGHLVLVPYLAGWEKHGLAFDVMLHVGTLGALLVYFRRELLSMTRGFLRLDTSPEGVAYRRVGLFLIAASVPVGIVGLLFKDRIEDAFESPLTASLMLLVTAGLLLALEAVRDRRVRTAGDPAEPIERAAVDAVGDVEAAGPRGASDWAGDWRADGVEAPAPPHVGLPLGTDPSDPTGTDLAGLTLKQAMTAGVLQCLAVLPGISRSGSTIAGGVFAGLTREAATRLSFMLAIPALIGATVLSVPDLAAGEEGMTVLAVGVGASFVSGYLAIRFLVGLVSRERLTGFAYYCLCASAVGLIGYAMLGPVSTV